MVTKSRFKFWAGALLLLAITIVPASTLGAQSSYAANTVVAIPTSAKTSVQRAEVVVNLYDGTRHLIPSDSKVFVRLLIGKHQVVSGFYLGPTIRFENVPLLKSGAPTYYRVIASRDQHKDGGDMAVEVQAGAEQVVDLMLTPDRVHIDFRNASADNLKANYPQYWRLIASGAASDEAAVIRWNELMKNDPLSAECLLNILTAMDQFHFSDGTSPLQYYQQLIWDKTMAQDRFFAWVEPQYIHELEIGTKEGHWQQQLVPGILHPGATRAWKQTQLDEANLNPTAHENNTLVINGKSYLMMETDIDYYKDLLAHGFGELIPNLVTGGLTDPRKVYQLRWNSGAEIGLASFAPPYVLTTALPNEKQPKKRHYHRDLRNVITFPKRAILAPKHLLNK